MAPAVRWMCSQTPERCEYGDMKQGRLVAPALQTRLLSPERDGRRLTMAAV
jgi:hypothetical protein